MTLMVLLSCTEAKQSADAGAGSPLAANSRKSASIADMVAMIRTEVDPAFVYPYEKTKFVPPAGKTLLIMGQDLNTITEYMENFSNRLIPGGWAAYWGITGMNGVDRMNTKDIARQFGYQNHQKLVDRYPDTVLQSGLWMTGKWGILENAGKGEYDSTIRQFSTWAKSVERPIYLRIGYEFDGKHNKMDPVDYVRTYRRIVDIIRAEGADTT